MNTQFSAVSYAWRLYSGKGALDHLDAVASRQRAKRAFVICGRSVATKTDLVDRIRRILGERFAGLYGEMVQEGPLDCVQAAVQAARDAAADMLIAVGAGTVIKATRVVAILLAESGAPETLMTQYPPSGPAISPKLLAPKLPIVNVLTAATSAQNRAGAAVKQLQLGQRMEFFDPKTRLRDYGVARALLDDALEFSMKNFNADRSRQFPSEREALARILDEAW